ncbi:MAG TPA: hypothetical protein PKM65_19490 [Spirochaetota bacterium]|nr:hypothetical protein [Spirochaetota bacterium]HNT12986.1 hypothetical protein [Spirochaetota bacterium]
MKPEITFECKNEKCEQHAKKLELHYSSFFGSMKEERDEDNWTARLKRCRTCYQTGEVKIVHVTRTFSDIEAFGEYVLGIAKEAKLLKMLVDRGVAEPDEKMQFKESMELLQDAKCPCCGQPLVETVEAEADAQQPVANDADKPRALAESLKICCKKSNCL